MAPSRKKVTSKAAATAAARQKWKVGDLVLAKVKGFPAWPATVSEPEKWGYSTDWKKVVVHFFGTQQIAFCSPADIEAFTEEKKQSLLLKRQGKGADFVRALQEIIDSHEKLKKESQVVGPSNSNEVTLKDDVIAVDSSAQNGLKDQASSEATHDSRIETLDSSAGVNELGTTDNATGSEETDALRDKESSTGQSLDNASIFAIPIIATYSSRKRSGGLRTRKLLSQKVPIQSVQRSRSSSRVESCRPEDITVPTNDVDITMEDLSTEIIQDGFSKRKKRTRKSPDVSELNDVVSSAFVSIDNIKDNDSEIVTFESEAVSFNKGSTLDPSCKLEHHETVAECSETECLKGDAKFSNGLDFQIKAVFSKKKRNPKRKRTTNGISETLSGLDLEEDSKAVVPDFAENECENLNVCRSKDDGDEHLPLLKRARVRMGKPVTENEEDNSVFLAGRSSSKVTVSSSDDIVSSVKCEDHSPIDSDSCVAKGQSEYASPSKGSSQPLGNRPQVEIINENHLLCSSVDGEATLPPSKRLHRAMEAMSANVAEEDPLVHARISPSRMKTFVAGLMKRCSHLVMDGKEGDSLEQHSVDSPRTSYGFCSTSKTSKESSNNFSGPDVFNHFMDSAHVEIPKSGKKYSESAGSIGSNSLCSSNFNAENDPISIETQIPDGAVHCVHRVQDNMRFEQLLTCKPEISAWRVPDVNFVKQHDILENFVARVEDDLRTETAGKVSPQDCKIAIHHSSEATVGSNTESLRSQIDDYGLVWDRSQVLKHNQLCERSEDKTSVSISNSFEAEDTLLVRSSPHPADRVDSPAQMSVSRISPLNTSTYRSSTSESAKFIQNGACSSSIHLKRKEELCVLVADKEEKSELVIPHRSKLAGKASTTAELHASLLSFEAMLGTLTRNKDIISRATRMAINCAKFGASAKVLETLARYLEGEISLHRRVDLFFLVDSIMQHSRNLKCNVGGLLISAIQSVLPRLLSAAAPRGSIGQENRKQCLKVLRLWLERRILPESVIRQHIQELDSWSGHASVDPYSRRSARTERALDDPVRDMEGMLVDEYGSNSSFQLHGFCMPRMLKDEDEGSDSDGGCFEAVTPEHNAEEASEEVDAIVPMEKHRHILEEVDGELEMEDVAPSCDDAEMNLGVNSIQVSHEQFGNHLSLPPLPQDVPPSSPPLPSSPPPPAPIHSHLLTHSTRPKPYANIIDSNHYNVQDDLQQQYADQSASLRLEPTIPSSVHYHASKNADHHQMQVNGLDSTSFPVRPINIQTGSPRFHHKPHPPRPPHPALSNQFSYFQSGQQMKSRREGPPPFYHNRSHSSRDFDGGNYYNDHERIKPAPYEFNDRWRCPPPRYSGPRYPDKFRSSYRPGSQHGLPREPTRSPNHGWNYPPRPFHHRHSVSFRPPPDNGFPVAVRGQSNWHPR